MEEYKKVENHRRSVNHNELELKYTGNQIPKSNLQLLADVSAVMPRIPLRRPGQNGRPGRQRKYFKYRGYNSNSAIESQQHTNKFSQTEPNAGTSRKTRYSPEKEMETAKYNVKGPTPVELAGYLSLLGESLSNIGDRLQQRAEQPVSGILSVLLDTLVCGMSPLLCLTAQIEELNCISPERLRDMLDFFAINMPSA